MELEFDDVKKIRKSLLITSAVGILFSKLVKFSTGTIDFLGFSLPIVDSVFLPNYIGYLIAFFIVALIIRYNNDSFKESYSKKIENIGSSSISNLYRIPSPNESVIRNQIADLEKKTKARSIATKYSVIVLDIVFPLVLGVIALVIIFFKL
ncbi:hypothetical protein DFQ09_11056 [Winogradskyella pacifica]|uniref:Uncharacterized protein n=1 Tax=Winogradskyella pacifica TaxID=664642 RepID=A0A3D9LKY5_9FLAO|nr:hypothetical protein [Winogradskyella pacifica]REE07862.1 hypothetical protein DFQ09_11056 [Winogradskyella pacifica]